MKRIFQFVFLSLSAINIASAQEVKPELLKQPVSWEFERFNYPPAFAPEITYKGFEELRFAPGMFKKDSVDYFTYAFVISIDSAEKISPGDIRIFLERYYKALCTSVAKDRKLTIDPFAITVTATGKKKTKGKQLVYDFFLSVFGVFADGAPVNLNLEATVTENKADQKTYILFIISPQPKTSVVWEKLYQIREDLELPGV